MTLILYVSICLITIIESKLEDEQTNQIYRSFTIRYWVFFDPPATRILYFKCDKEIKTHLKFYRIFTCSDFCVAHHSHYYLVEVITGVNGEVH